MKSENTKNQSVNEKNIEFVKKAREFREDWILLVVTLLLLAVNVIRIFNISISGDEGFTLMLSKMSMPDMLAATAADVHPPFYYMMMMAFGKLTGYTAIAGRVLSYLAIVVAAVIANTYLKKRFGARAALLFFALLTFTTNAIEMVVEIRMYTWSMVFVLLTGIFAYELMEAQEAYKGNLWKWMGLCVFGLAAAYSHYYALIMVALIYGCLFLYLVVKSRKNILPCVLVSVVSVVVYFPWLLVLLKQFGTVSDNYWISSIEVKDWIRYIFGANYFGKLLRVILVVSAGIFLFTQDGLQIKSESITWKWAHFDAKRAFVLLCGITTLGTIGVGAVVSYIFRPLYVSRYIYSALGLVTLAFGIAFTHCSKKKIYTWILLIFILFYGAGSFKEQYDIEKTYQSEETIAYFQEHLEPKDVLVTNYDQLSWTVLRYYYPDHEIIPLGTYNLMEADFDECWYLNYGTELDERIVAFEKQGMKVTYIMDTGIGRYPYSLYKLENRNR